MSDVSFALEVLDSLDLPKDPIAWLMVRTQEKADHYRETGNELKAREMDDRAGSLRVRLHNARIATIGDERANPELFSRSKLDRLADTQPRQSKAQARTELEQIFARRKAAAQPTIAKTQARADLDRVYAERDDR
jgi:hypothetical protein